MTDWISRYDPEKPYDGQEVVMRNAAGQEYHAIYSEGKGYWPVVDLEDNPFSLGEFSHWRSLRPGEEAQTITVHEN